MASFTAREGLAGFAAVGGRDDLFVADGLLPAFVGLEALAAFAAFGPFAPFDFDAFATFDAFETFVFAIRP